MAALMHITKAKLENFLESLPEQIDTEEVMYRLYLLEKIEAGEEDIREGRTVPHEEAVRRLSRKWQQ
jgi:predicted transcriptional regulator